MSINQCKHRGAEGNMVKYGMDCIEPGVIVIDGPLKPALDIFKAARLFNPSEDFQNEQHRQMT